MKVIGLGYKSRVGKDTAANLLVMNHGYFRFSFASHLKKHCQKLFPLLQSEDYYNQNPEFRTIPIPEYGVTPVQIWVTIGTVCREINPNIWIEKLHEEILDSEPLIGKFVISDVRNINEVEFIKSLGGICVHIDRKVPEQPGATIDGLLEGFDGWDYKVLNHLDMDYLERQMDEIARRV